MSGLTAQQLKLLTLYGGLEAIEWLTVEAQHVCAGPAPMGNPALHESLLKLQLTLTHAQALCLETAYPKGIR